MNPDKAKKIIEEIFSKLGFLVEVVYELNPQRGHIFIINSQDFAAFVGERDEIVKDLVFLIKRIFNKDAKAEDIFRCTIDINGEQSRRDDYLKMKALNAAEEARSLKTDVVLPPMSSYERMIIHSALAGVSDIKTESVGEGKSRQVKLKYKPI